MKFFKNAKMMLAAIMGAGLLISASPAMATRIMGGINFNGEANYIGGTTAATATGVDFVGNWDSNGDLVVNSLDILTGGLNGYTAGGVSGSYVGVPNFTPVDFTDFLFSPTMTPSPVAPLWTFVSGGLTYDFDMTSVVATVSGNALKLAGEGILGITGFDDTEGYWTLTMQDGVADLTFSASSVPEPATLLLLGTGLVGIGFFSRRKNEVV